MGPVIWWPLTIRRQRVRPPPNMSTFAKAAEVHRALVATFSPWCKRAGFKRISSGRCAYAKPSKDGLGTIVAFEVQCSSFGGAEHGGMFALNAGAGVMDPRYLSGPHARVLKYCPAELLALARSTEASILASEPRLAKPRCSWEAETDNWCQYYEVNHVRQWGEVLLPFLPGLLNELLIRAGLSTHEFELLTSPA